MEEDSESSRISQSINRHRKLQLALAAGRATFGLYFLYREARQRRIEWQQ
jgi:hypothetical protein